MKKFTINADLLLTGMQPLISVIQEKHIIPILECVKIELLDNKLYLVGDNTEINCVNILDIWSEEKISFCVNFTMLLSILKNVIGQELQFKIDDKQVKIIHKKGDFKLPIFQAKDFPEIRRGDLKKKVILNGADFKDSLKVASKFILNINLEPMANISIEIGKKTTIRSTNKICLFEERIKGKGHEQTLLISGKACAGILTLLEDGKIEMQYNDNRVFIKTKNREIIILQQNGVFPLKMFNKILSSMKKSEELEVDFEDLNIALKRTSTLSQDEKSNLVKLEFTPADIEISCENEAMSSRAHETIKCNFTDERAVGYNSKVLLEILSVFDSKVKFSINEFNALCLNSKKKKGLIAPLLLKD